MGLVPSVCVCPVAQVTVGDSRCVLARAGTWMSACVCVPKFGRIMVSICTFVTAFNTSLVVPITLCDTIVSPGNPCVHVTENSVCQCHMQGCAFALAIISGGCIFPSGGDHVIRGDVCAHVVVLLWVTVCVHGCIGVPAGDVIPTAMYA